LPGHPPGAGPGGAPVALSRRAAALLGELREEYAWVEPGKTFLVVQDEGIHW